MNDCESELNKLQVRQFTTIHTRIKTNHSYKNEDPAMNKFINDQKKAFKTNPFGTIAYLNKMKTELDKIKAAQDSVLHASNHTRDKSLFIGKAGAVNKANKIDEIMGKMTIEERVAGLGKLRDKIKGVEVEQPSRTSTVEQSAFKKTDELRSEMVRERNSVNWLREGNDTSTVKAFKEKIAEITEEQAGGTAMPDSTPSSDKDAATPRPG